MDPALTPARLAVATVVVLTAYLVRGVTGFGSALVAVPLLAWQWPLSLVVPAIVLLDYLAALTHSAANFRTVSWRDLLPLLPFTVLGVVTALYLFREVHPELLVKALGAFVLGYALYSLGPLQPQQLSRRWAAPAAFLGGLVGTLFGTGGPFYVIYLRLRQHGKASFRATVAMIFMLDGGLRLVGFTQAGMYPLDTLLLVAGALPLVALGLLVGGRLHQALDERSFVRVVSLLLLVSGLALLLR